ncbi:MAG TPA: hypothetical protein VGR69_06085 [Candidatus Rubrimentiphilum sp.]|nr:hypothetical protein [Candidatus Rubrimentiphilum sp.]
MKRVLLLSALIPACLWFSQTHAVAQSEFCPADFEIAPVGNVKSGEPASLYGFALTALGPRTLTATLAFDTSAGWFMVTVPPVSLTEKDRHYSGPSSSWIRPDWISPIMYMRFGVPVLITRSWVYRAHVVNDQGSHWAAQGEVTCPPSPDIATARRKSPRVEMNPADRDPLSAAPARGMTILAATQGTALEKTGCAVPFQDASAAKQVAPNYPYDMRGRVSSSVTSGVEILVDADGRLGDAWMWAPSGISSFDNTALEAARASTYRPARAYCQDVPGYYLFWVTFAPH